MVEPVGAAIRGEMDLGCGELTAFVEGGQR